MWSLAIGVLLLGAVGAEVVTFENCPVSGKTARVALRYTASDLYLLNATQFHGTRLKVHCIYCHKQSTAFTAPIFTNLTNAQQRCVQMSMPRRTTCFILRHPETHKSLGLLAVVQCCIQRKGCRRLVLWLSECGPWTRRYPRGYFCLSVASYRETILCLIFLICYRICLRAIMAPGVRLCARVSASSVHSAQ